MTETALRISDASFHYLTREGDSRGNWEGEAVAMGGHPESRTKKHLQETGHRRYYSKVK